MTDLAPPLAAEARAETAPHEGAARGRFLILACLAILATAGLYLFLARQIAGELGYPLDDAWIHQTYARNLALHSEWAYVRGVPSAGSTAPLWTIVLSLGHLLPLGGIAWSYLVGLLTWAGTAWGAGRLSYALFRSAPLAWLTGLAVLVEWHMAWAALSGMEIPLYTLLVTLLLSNALEQTAPDRPATSARPLRIGLLGGLLTLTRPEGLWALGLVGLLFLWQGRSLGWRPTLNRLFLIGLGWGLLVGPVAAYNLQVTGSVLPSTFYAKQQEYGELLATIPLWERLLTQAWLPWIGGQVLLLAGLLFALARHGRAERVAWYLPLIWALGIVVLYALRLPVEYQHGRYLMPTIPVFLVYGVWGLQQLSAALPWLWQRTLTLSAAILFVVFWLQGGLAYARDNAIITCEMVGTARWLVTNTPPNALIAAHDIGAIGYFTERPLLDLAGLVTPETIPILRNEQALLDLMQARDVAYVVTFPDWYQAIPKAPELAPLIQQQCPVSAEMGQTEGMTVYGARWAPGP